MHTDMFVTHRPRWCVFLSLPHFPLPPGLRAHCRGFHCGGDNMQRVRVTAKAMQGLRESFKTDTEPEGCLKTPYLLINFDLISVKMTG